MASVRCLADLILSMPGFPRRHTGSQARNSVPSTAAPAPVQPFAGLHTLRDTGPAAIHDACQLAARDDRSAPREAPSQRRRSHGVILARRPSARYVAILYMLSTSPAWPATAQYASSGAVSSAGASGRRQAARNRINAAQIFNSTSLSFLSGPTTSIILMRKTGYR